MTDVPWLIAVLAVFIAFMAAEPNEGGEGPADVLGRGGGGGGGGRCPAPRANIDMGVVSVVNVIVAFAGI